MGLHHSFVAQLVQCAWLHRFLRVLWLSLPLCVLLTLFLLFALFFFSATACLPLSSALCLCNSRINSSQVFSSELRGLNELIASFKIVKWYRKFRPKNSWEFPDGFPRIHPSSQSYPIWWTVHRLSVMDIRTGHNYDKRFDLNNGVSHSMHLMGAKFVDTTK